MNVKKQENVYAKTSQEYVHTKLARIQAQKSHKNMQKAQEFVCKKDAGIYMQNIYIYMQKIQKI